MENCYLILRNEKNNLGCFMELYLNYEKAKERYNDIERYECNCKLYRCERIE